MSFHEQNIEAFIELLTDRRSSRLFSVEDREDLLRLISRLPDDIEKLSEALAGWYEKHSDILDAQLDVLNEILLRDNGSGANASPFLVNKQGLENAIQKGAG